MPTLSDLVSYCDTRTRRTAFTDSPGACNGLQLANDGRVTKIGAAVDAGVIPFQKAAAAGIDYLIVHHGMYWDMPRPITGPVYDRVSTLIKANCALYSNHLPLDAHPEIGNNALYAKQLGLSGTRGFIPNPGGDIGLICANRTPRAELRAKLESLYPRVIAIEYGAETPSEVAFCSGGGSSALRELVKTDVDTLITGELRGRTLQPRARGEAQPLPLRPLCHRSARRAGPRRRTFRKIRPPWEFIPTKIHSNSRACHCEKALRRCCAAIPRLP